MNEKTVSRYCPFKDDDIQHKEAVTYKKKINQRRTSSALLERRVCCAVGAVGRA
jgi:hypothetical protein